MPRAITYFVSLLLLNAAYLHSFDSPSVFYVLNVLLHAGGGLILTLAVAKVIRDRFREWPIETRLAAVAGLIAGVSGMVLIYSGTSRPYLSLLRLHIVLSCLAVTLFLLHLVRSHGPWIPVAMVFATALATPAAVSWWRSSFPDPLNRISNPVPPPTSLEGETAGPDSPFFPSAARTDVGHTIPSEFFMKPESCGRVRCHPDIYDQWSSSAHRFSSFNNQWYRKSIEYMQDTIGTKPSKWCAGCHDHAVFFNGMMDTPAREILDRPEAHAGLTCTSCHSIVAVNSSMGNGDFVIEYPPLHDLATSDNFFLRNMHDFVVHLDPGPHKQTFLKPFFRSQTAEFCSSCHKVHLDIPVNNYRWFRGFNEYDGWQASGVSGQGARSFYYPPEPKKCVDCHMPLVASQDKANIDGKVHSHRFPGANTALPVVNRDEEQLRTTVEFLQDDQVSIDIFALSEASTEESDESYRAPGLAGLQVASGFAEGDEMGFAVGRGTGYTEARAVIAPIDRVQPQVKRGETIRIDVVVRTRNVGHFFPGGTVDAFDVWVELKAEDNQGKVLFWSGYVPEVEGRKGPVDPGAHFYKSFLLDEHGNPINKRNAWAARSVLYVRLIPPGAADTAHYRMAIPEDAGDEIRLTARLNYRKFSWWNTQWAFAGIRDPNDLQPQIAAGYDDGRWIFAGDTSTVSGELKEIPDLPVVTMATDRAILRVAADDSEVGAETVLDQRDLYRWNDYGIGLLLQGDLKAAEFIFEKVTEVDPDYADGWVNIGRVRVREGRTEAAQEVLLRALEVAPELAKTHYFLALTYKTQGQYDKALEHLKTAAAQYPRDRVVLNQIGRIRFLRREFQEAVSVLKQVLLIDAEDLQAHYSLMLCYRGLGNREAAEHEQKLYLRYKADESSQAITGAYRRSNPEDNNERQAIHEHQSFPLGQIPGVQPSGTY